LTKSAPEKIVRLHSTSPASAAMLNLINGFHVARAVYIAARLDLADCVKGGASSCEALAARTDTDAAALYRVMRVLVSAGVFEMDEHERVALNPLAQTLLKEAPGSLRGWAVSQLGDDSSSSWSELLYSVRTGGVAFEHVFGCDSWTHRATHPDSAKDFDEGMASFIGAHDRAVVDCAVFATARKVIDVGGGDGKLIAALLAAHPTMRGVVFEQPRVIERAIQRMSAQGLAARCEVVAGDMFTAVPEGGDIYVLSRVLHDWDDARANAILLGCRRAMSPTAKLVVVERAIPARIEHSAAMRVLTVSDVHMMVMNGGRERTLAQYRELFAAAGLELTAVMPTGGAMSVIEGSICATACTQP
jgi:ubiquinone/menaquinone biosynthesis C-methylase UbiE